MTPVRSPNILPELLFVLLILPHIPFVHSRTFTVKNSCSFTIWPALYTDPNVGTAVPNQSTGWEAASSSSVSFAVPDNWKAGRIWGRRNCNFGSGSTDPNTCQTGGCNGGLLCDKSTGTGVPPTTVAEWTLQGDGNRDFYDVSLVDGYDLPMRITNTKGCPVADCPVDLAQSCPDQLKGPADASGTVLGCKSACAANVDGNQADSANCCSGSHNTPQTCPNTGVAFYSFFKGNCPNAYAYAYDESSGTALWACDSSLAADYTLEFCPSGASNSTTANAGSSVTSSPTPQGSTSTSDARVVFGLASLPRRFFISYLTFVIWTFSL